MTSEKLDSITPREAQSLYLEERQEDAAYDTLQTVEQGTDLFIKWCEKDDEEQVEERITDMNDLTGRDLRRFKSWCKENTENNNVSLNGILSTVRRFLVDCVDIEAVSPDLPNKVPIPKVPDDEDVCYEKPSDEEVEQVLRYLEKYKPGSRRHVEFAMIAEVGIRVGALRAVDDPEDLELDGEEPAIKLRHRPEGEPDEEKGTPLKNGNDGQRNVNISTDLVELIQSYREKPDQGDVEDRFGRTPLLTTKGRPQVTTIRRDFYKLTRPCVYAGHCPHDDYDMESCEARRNNSKASKCPSSFTPHPLRRWSIENQIDEGVPKDILSDRVDVSVPILNKHYDTRSEERKRKQRLKILEKLLDGYGDSDETLTPQELAAITDDDGMINPVELHQLTKQGNSLQNTPLNTTDNTGRDSRNDDESGNQMEGTQLTLGDLDKTTAINQPALVPIIATATVIEWVPDRLRRELVAMTPDSEDPSWPSRGRAVKGTAAYALYVCMVAVNLTLIGLLPA